MKAIIATSLENAIGTETGLPWHCPMDMKWFRYCTLNKTVLMGRVTMETLKGPLPDRENLVLSKTLPKGDYNGFTVINCPSELPEETDDIVIIGGAAIYTLFRRDINTLIVSNIDISVPNATVFMDTTFLTKGMVLASSVRSDTPAFEALRKAIGAKPVKRADTKIYSINTYER
jgi:dihydrofolate reductase